MTIKIHVDYDKTHDTVRTGADGTVTTTRVPQIGEDFATKPWVTTHENPPRRTVTAVDDVRVDTWQTFIDTCGDCTAKVQAHDAHDRITGTFMCSNTASSCTNTRK
jgi:hypothetical protein